MVVPFNRPETREPPRLSSRFDDLAAPLLCRSLPCAPTRAPAESRHLFLPHDENDVSRNLLPLERHSSGQRCAFEISPEASMDRLHQPPALPVPLDLL